MAHSGTAHRAVSVFLRLWQLASATIVLGILSRFCYLITIAGVNADGRIVYSMVVAGIGIVYSFFFCPPFNALFLSFPIDFILFIMWLVAFCLLETKTGSSACSGSWYYDYWGYYWGRYWRVGPAGRVDIHGAGCGYWRTVLAFSFMACIAHLLSGFLGIYVFHKYVRLKDTAHDIKRHTEKLAGRPSQANSYEHARAVENGTESTQPAVT